jgi:two-component system sensor histidine kinase CpxA
VAISILLWIPFAWNITRYIRRLTRRTISIARGNFEANEITHRGDELGRLGMAIDRLRQRLRGYVDGQKRFTSDIAHELCTPLARMQLSLGVLEQQSPISPETIIDLRDEVQQMSGMVDELLDFSRASISPDQVTLETFDLAALARDVIEREAATMASVDIHRKTHAKANPHLLRRALGNVVRNAMLHAPGKEILIHTSTSSDTLEILVDDKGPGIPDKDLPRIFEPFYRVDGARTREAGGTGLGLAIVSTCMEGCRGTASCENLSSGGLRVILTLPLA